MSFPPLRMAVLTGLIGLQDHLDTLDNADCPYDNETKDALRKLLAPRIVEKVVEKEIQVEAKVGRGRPTKDVKISAEDQQMVLDELRKSIEDIKKMGDGQMLDTASRLSIAKTKAGLLDQVLKMMERHTTAQKVSSFMEEVIKILDDLVGEGEREIMMKRLEAFR